MLDILYTVALVAERRVPAVVADGAPPYQPPAHTHHRMPAPRQEAQLTDEQLIDAMCAMWFGEGQWKRWSPRPEGENSRHDMAAVLAIVESEIRRRVLDELVADLDESKDKLNPNLSVAASAALRILRPTIAEPPPELCARPGCGLPRNAYVHSVHAFGCSLEASRHHDFVSPAPKCATCGGEGETRCWGPGFCDGNPCTCRTPFKYKCGACNGTGRAKEKP